MGRLCLGAVSESHPGTAKRPEPLCRVPVLPPRGWDELPPGRALPLRRRSYGLMRQTSTLQPASAMPRTDGLCRLLPVPCWAQALPDVISANLSPRVWTSTPAAPRVHVPVTSPRTCLPRVRTGSARRVYPTTTSVGISFRSCSHLLMFRPAGLLATPVVPTSQPVALGGRGFYIRAYHGSLPCHAADMLTVQNRAIDGKRTCTSPDWQPCRLLPLLEITQDGRCEVRCAPVERGARSRSTGDTPSDPR
jgi:hypothetical protein